MGLPFAGAFVSRSDFLNCVDSFAAVLNAIAERLDTIDDRMKVLKPERRQRRGAQHLEEKIAAVREAMLRYGESIVARCESSRPTLKGAFLYSRNKLESIGIATVAEFRKIKHAIDMPSYRTRLKSLHDAQGSQTANRAKNSHN